MGTHKKIGIMGGTFNPIHYGHLLLAETAFNQFGLDEMLIMPTKNTYYKDSSNLVSKEERVEMVSLAIEDNEHFTLSTIELEREGTTYTAETLDQLTKEHPEQDYYFIMGADSLYHIESWWRTADILRMATIVVADRGGNGPSSALTSQIEYIENKYDARILRLNTPVLEISSNDIRRRVRHGESIRYILPQKVVEYIYERGLYQKRAENAEPVERKPIER